MLNITTIENRDANVYVYDVYGKSITKKTFVLSEGSNEYMLDLSTNECGTYYLSIFLCERLEFIKLIIIIK
jgi:hypothetical protein